MHTWHQKQNNLYRIDDDMPCVHFLMVLLCSYGRKRKRRRHHMNAPVCTNCHALDNRFGRYYNSRPCIVSKTHRGMMHLHEENCIVPVGVAVLYTLRKQRWANTDCRTILFDDILVAFLWIHLHVSIHNKIAIKNYNIQH